jgi:transcriptional regulator with PAS, ATPase and Fis domain
MKLFQPGGLMKANNFFYLKSNFSNKVNTLFFDQSMVTLGSSNDVQVVLPVPELEDRHCRIEQKEHGFILKDLRSQIGTYLNGARILEAFLQDGDQIRLGETQISFHTQNPEIKITNELKSKNAKWESQLQALPYFAATNYPVLVLGPSGSGKEIIANKIHDFSLRSKGPFVSVNCSALTETLIESELFGHIKGSFTGAIADRKGAFETARGGTLFLDEIGDLPYSLQAKLLRALENKEIRPVGSDRTIQTDVRIIAATHQNLKSLISEKSFRNDLFYRLNVINFQTPSLQQRMEDFDDIFFSLCKEFRIRFNFDSIQKLKGYNWPGNIRELKNIVTRAAALYPSSTITEDMIDILFDDTEEPSIVESLPTQPEFNSVNNGVPTNIIKEIEKQMILTRLAANNGNQRRTAQDLGIPKSTLHDRIKMYKIDLGKPRA